MIFHRAIRREFRQTAAGVFVALFAILITTVLVRLLGQAAGGRVPADAVMALIGFGALAYLPVLLSLTLFVAVLLTLSRAYRDSEMVVWFASGVPLSAFVRPVLQFAVPMVVVIAGLTMVVTPWAYMQNEAFRAELDSRDDTTRVAPGIFRESTGALRVFFVETGADADGMLRNVFVASEEGGRLDVVSSSQGTIIVDEHGDRFVVLERGRRYDGVPGQLDFRVVEFERYQILVEERRRADQTVRTKATPTPALLSDPTDRHLGEFVGRVGVPVAALLLALMAIPLSFVNPRAGRGFNMLIAIFSYVLYTNVIGVTQAWVSQGRVEFLVALFAPHVVVIGVLMLLFHKRMAIMPFWRKVRA